MTDDRLEKDETTPGQVGMNVTSLPCGVSNANVPRYLWLGELTEAKMRLRSSASDRTIWEREVDTRRVNKLTDSRLHGGLIQIGWV